MPGPEISKMGGRGEKLTRNDFGGVDFHKPFLREVFPKQPTHSSLHSEDGLVGSGLDEQETSRMNT